MKWWKKINFRELEKELKQEYKEKEKKKIYETALEKCKNNEEMWVVCKEYPDYKISNMGNVLYTKKGILVIQREVSNGSKIVILRKDNRSITCTVASLVANSFEIPNENNKKNVYHIKEIDNNRLDNLSYNEQYSNIIKNKYLERKGEKKKMEKEYSDKERIDNELVKNKKWLPIPEQVEMWKDVIDYERWYEVSNLGNVRKINDDGTRKILKAKPSEKGRTVGLRKVDKVKTYQVSHLVAEAFNVKTTEKNKSNVYHIDGDINNDCLSNLTYDKKETEAYKEEQERLLKEEQEKFNEILKQEESDKNELLDYIENNKEFLQQTKEINNEITLGDIYNKLNEILEVLKNENNCR